MQVIGAGFCVTSALGIVEMTEKSCGEVLCDIWAGQGGNGCMQFYASV